jgi:hypothetical protein
VKITPEGWKIIPEVDAIFPTSELAQELIAPIRGGKINRLWEILGLPESDGALILAWLLSCLHDGPYQALIVAGPDAEHSEFIAKSIRDILDPCREPLRSLPKNDGEVAAAANSSFVLGYNVDGSVPNKTQSLFCRVMTNVAIRKYREGVEHVIFRGRRPIVLTCNNLSSLGAGILQRSLIINLEESQLRSFSQEKAEANFLAYRQAILGSLLDIASTGLSRVETTELHSVIRDRHFEKLVAACASKHWNYPSFQKAYEKVCLDVIEDTLEDDTFLSAFLNFINREQYFKGTASELLVVLRQSAHNPGNRWPSSPRAVSERLRRHRFKDIDVTFNHREGRARRRMIIARAKSPVITPLEPILPHSGNSKGPDDLFGLIAAE